MHDNIMKLLKKIKQDGTYDQDRAFQLILEKTRKVGSAYSFDLSSATDRFPLDPQLAVINRLYGHQAGQLWKEIIAERDFDSPIGPIRWGTGQPLGALSSWGTFALTHHLFVRFCAGSYAFPDYVILGDDIVILDSKVASNYKLFMKELGVEINIKKSFTTDSGAYGEFAKRLFLKGNEITGLPVHLLLEASKTLYMIPDLLTFIATRWKLPFMRSELYAPSMLSHLSKKGQEFLSVILSFQNALEGHVSGYPWCSVDNLKHKVHKMYLEEYERKIDEIFDQGSKFRNELITRFLVEPLKKDQGNHVSDMVLMSLRIQAHPLSMLGMKSIGQLSNARMSIMENVKDLDHLLVEFLPDPHLRAYSYDRKTVRSTRRGQIGMKLYFEMCKSVSSTT